MAKGTFYVHFPDRAAFLVALHVQFHERQLEHILQAVEGLTPGAERLRRGTEVYLDECLRQRAVKAILLEARSEAVVAQEVQRRNASFSQFEQVDFATLAWPEPAMAARLFVALGAKVALIELETGCNEAARPQAHRIGQFHLLLRVDRSFTACHDFEHRRFQGLLARDEHGAYRGTPVQRLSSTMRPGSRCGSYRSY